MIQEQNRLGRFTGSEFLTSVLKQGYVCSQCVCFCSGEKTQTPWVDFYLYHDLDESRCRYSPVCICSPSGYKRGCQERGQSSLEVWGLNKMWCSQNYVPLLISPARAPHCWKAGLQHSVSCWKPLGCFHGLASQNVVVIVKGLSVLGRRPRLTSPALLPKSAILESPGRLLPGISACRLLHLLLGNTLITLWLRTFISPLTLSKEVTFPG